MSKNGMTTGAQTRTILCAVRHSAQVEHHLNQNGPLFHNSGSERLRCSDATKCVEQCEQEWEENGDHCYYWSKDTKTWVEAEQFCKGEGGHRASVTSAATHGYIAAQLKHFLWIGGSDRESEGDWKWSDCSTWDFTNWGTISGKQQPSNHGGHNCLEYYIQNRKWNDGNCNIPRNFLCSRRLCSGENFHFKERFFAIKYFSTIGANPPTVTTSTSTTYQGINIFIYIL